MRLKVFDVGHGSCAYFVADNGNVMLFDCGSSLLFQPSKQLRTEGCTGVELLVLSNYDEDHISGLPQLRDSTSGLKIDQLLRNKSVSPKELRALKQECGPISDAMESLLDMMALYNQPAIAPVYANTTWQCFHNSYPAEFCDTNNLSLVTFLHAGDLHVVFPGDLTTVGWERLLQNAEFRAQLSTVNIFIASHHGREDGYCPAVFEHCRPEVVVFSDGAKEFDTQETVTTYACHATGITIDGALRRVLTTRADGHITIEQLPGQGLTITMTPGRTVEAPWQSFTS